MEAEVPVVRNRFELAAFGRSWRHCDLTSNYLGRAAGRGPDDRRLYYLCSTVVNELLEIVFRHGARQGTMNIDLFEESSRFRLEIRMPTTVELDRLCAAYGRWREGDDPAAAYLSLLGSAEPPDFLGLLQIVSDYGVELVCDSVGGAFRMRAWVPGEAT